MNINIKSNAEAEISYCNVQQAIVFSVLIFQSSVYRLNPVVFQVSIKVKVKLSLYQAMEAHRIVRR
jgi:hypothetical protein